MKNALAVLLLVLSLSACQPAQKPVLKVPPFNFDTVAEPAPSAFSKEADLLASWNDGGVDSLKDFWSSGEAGTFDGVGGVKVAWHSHRVANPKADVVLMPGRTEAIIKFAEVARDLNRQGYSTWSLTLRGQGEAARILNDPHKGYVDWFDDYVEDTHTFISTVVKARSEASRVFIVAHSLGGGVATLLVDEHPDDVQALALSAPMLDINLGAFPPPVAATLAGGICDATDGSGYAIGSGPYAEETDFDKNSVTHSKDRWTWKVQQLRDDESIRLGGITWRWLCQALVGSSRAQSVGGQSATPTVVLQAGADTIINRPGQERYCTEALNCTFSRVDDAKHEILQERDDLRNVAMSRIVKFFDAQVTP